MSSGNGKRPVIRADKRHSGSTTTARTGTKAPGKSAASKAKGSKASAGSARAAGGGRGGRGTRRRRQRGLLGLILLPFAWLARLGWSILWRATAVLVLLVGFGVAYFYSQLPPLDDLLDGRVRGSVTLLDRNGDVFAWRGETFDQITDINDVSPYLKNAVIATEDRRFYRHLGVSPRGVASAVRINLAEGRGPLSGNGGSTLTQQTAKLLCLGVPFDPDSGMTEAEYEDDCRRTTMGRKIKEALYAMALEAKYGKDDILVLYFNRAYLGASARGFEAAAQKYFGITAAELDPGQAAMLAGLLKAPTRYAPTNSLKRAQDRADTVIKLMYDQGFINAAQRDYAWEYPATLGSAAQARAGGYFADWVMDTGPSFLTNNTTEDVTLQTTLDPRIQTAIEEAMRVVFDEKVKADSEAQAAIVVMSADGAVRGMVGGRDTKVSGAFNRATQAKRQTGSSFKPFVYAAAMDLGYTPFATVLDDVYCVNVPGSGQYCPSNYDHKFHGRVTLAQALAHSYNVPAVKVAEAVGLENVRKVASDFGIDNKLAVGPALALGVSESTLVEMTGAYAGILNGGRSVKPYGVTALMLQDDDQPLMGQSGGLGERVISEEASQYLIYMMSKVIEEGTGQRAKLGSRPAAGKTGTTQAARDAWFIGFTADYVTGVWLGNDDNAPLTGVTGSGLPAEIWREAMVRVNEGLPEKPLPMKIPDNAPSPTLPGETATSPQYDGSTTGASSRGTGTGEPSQRQNPVERLLNGLFGRRN
ncbi:transglycosylase domain-containing protein [Tropicimonas sp. IMCC34043]|uniref:transglycosylase domain-containing protein n=1 Tax=Tropicimonas sp. IMCC34043 TaxID=2248760 RepID=UPI000E25732B|nr:transglycosylase domain-containing protein [Tropicimonas sp. IMCC34043]